MAGKSGARARKRVEATESAVLKRARDGSAFTRCEACGKSVSVVLIDMHNCSLDDKIRISLEAQVVEQAVEVASKKSGKGKSGKKNKAGAKKGKRPPTAFFLFMTDFRKDYKAEHPDNKSVSTVAKEGGEKWKSMSDEEKKPYFDKAAELKAEYESGERSDENNAGGNAGEQEVDQSPKKGASARTDDHDEDEDDNDDDDEPEEKEKNESDDI